MNPAAIAADDNRLMIILKIIIIMIIIVIIIVIRKDMILIIIIVHYYILYHIIWIGLILLMMALGLHIIMNLFWTVTDSNIKENYLWYILSHVATLIWYLQLFSLWRLIITLYQIKPHRKRYAWSYVRVSLTDQIPVSVIFLK